MMFPFLLCFTAVISDSSRQWLMPSDTTREGTSTVPWPSRCSVRVGDNRAGFIDLGFHILVNCFFFVFHHFFLDLLIGVYFYCLIMMFIGFVHVFFHDLGWDSWWDFCCRFFGFSSGIYLTHARHIWPSSNEQWDWISWDFEMWLTASWKVAVRSSMLLHFGVPCWLSIVGAALTVDTVGNINRLMVFNVR